MEMLYIACLQSFEILLHSHNLVHSIYSKYISHLKKILCSVKEQFILILELPYKMVQLSEYLIMARKNTGRYFNIFYSLS